MKQLGPVAFSIVSFHRHRITALNADRVGADRLALSLQVLEDAAVAEVVDVPAQVHQLRVHAVGHEAVGGDGAVGGAGHRLGTVGHALRAALHQGTKSATSHAIVRHVREKRF